MFKIHRRLEYALLALSYMGRKFPGQVTSAKEICDFFQIPFDPTSRVLQIMTRHGIIKAEQGARGGYQIVRDLTRVSLDDLNKIIVGPTQITLCLQGKKAKCLTKNCCEISAAMRALNQRVEQLFGAFSISDVMEYNQRAKQKTTAHQ